jgi:anti-sigma B factor antagonist
MSIRNEALVIEDLAGPNPGQRILRLTGPLVISNFFEFQSKIRSDESKALIIDFTNVPYADSAGIGALVGAYVSRQKNGRSLSLAGVNDRVRAALKVTHVEQFFRFFDDVASAEQAIAS